MNFKSELEGQVIHVELKYCERCGGLWLRPEGAEEVYCASCRAVLAAMPNAEEAPARKARRRKARLPGASAQGEAAREDLGRPVRIDYLEGVAAMEVCV
jgi:LSD1 subclass zinc finger protein